jgi:hypothetical protein
MDQARRRFLGISAMAAAVASVPAAAWAMRVRVLEGGSDPDRIAEPVRSSPELGRFVAGLRLGPAQARGALTVVWIAGQEPKPPLDVATLDEARASGALVVAEQGQATVPELIADNRGKAHVLLLAGEILVGGKQNRVLREDLLLPPLSGPRNLGVYCVEQGRWNTGRTEFESKASLAAPRLRSHLMDKADQGTVWAEVGRQARAAQAPSPTSSYQAILEKPEVKEHLLEVERAVGLLPPAGVLGAAVFAGQNPAGLDLFRSGELFRREWPKLLRAAALEAYRQPLTPADPGSLRESVKALLGRAAAADGVLRTNAGVGGLFEFADGRARGAALVYEGALVHAAIL